jgi:hypothetical protein
VADDHERAGPRVEHVFQSPQGVEVEVVRRLVEQQHVGRLAQHQGVLQAPAFPSGQQPDRRPLRVVVEPQPLEERRIGPVGLPGGPGDDLTHALVGWQVGAALVEITETNGRSVHDAAATGGSPAGHEVEQRRLAAAVDPDDAQTLAGAQQQVDTLEQQVVAIAIGDAVELDDRVPEARRPHQVGQRQVVGDGRVPTIGYEPAAGAAGSTRRASRSCGSAAGRSRPGVAFGRRLSRQGSGDVGLGLAGARGRSPA